MDIYIARCVNTFLSPVDEVIGLSSHIIGKKEIQLLNEVAELPVMNIDKARIQQVLQNVIGNAVKFTEKGVITVSSAVTTDWVQINIAGILKEVTHS